MVLGMLKAAVSAFPPFLCGSGGVGEGVEKGGGGGGEAIYRSNKLTFSALIKKHKFTRLFSCYRETFNVIPHEF